MTKTVKVGFIAAPELAEELALSLTKILPDSLEKRVSADVKWEVEFVVDHLTGAAESVSEMISESIAYRNSKTWDYIISLTDLPVFNNEHVVAFEINHELRVGLISIPAFGWRPVLKRIQNISIYTIREMIRGADNDALKSSIKEKRSRLFRSIFPGLKIKREKRQLQESGTVHTRFFLTPRFLGIIRLLSGMTYANNPLRMMVSLTTIVALAFTTGAFGLIFTTMWQLSYLFTLTRLVAITVTAIAGMVIWIIIAHDLWEPLTASKNKRVSKYYNITTAITLTIAVSVYYGVLFLLFLVSVLIFVPPSFLANVLEMEHAAGIPEYLRLAWFATSISTVAGAIGAGLENEQLILESTYGYRQNKRQREQEHTNY